MKYKVIVGNIGTVLDTDNFKEATSTYKRYCQISDANHGRVSNEPVTLFKNDEPWREYLPLEKS